MKFWNAETLLLFSRISSILIILITLVGCFTSDDQMGESISSGSDCQTEPIRNKKGVIPEYMAPLSISEQARASTVIAIGQVEQDRRVINSARDPNDISKPDSNLLGLGQVYQLHVEKILKGDNVGSTLLFVQNEGHLSMPQTSANPSSRDVRLARQYGDYFPFIPGRRYLLFLTPAREFETEQYWGSGGSEPWRFDATDENHVCPQILSHVDTAPVPLAEVIKQIEASLAPVPESTIISPLPTPQPMNTFPPALP